MKNIVFLIFFLVSSMFGQQPIYHDVNRNFHNGESYVLFGNEVKFRAAPEVTSRVIKILKIGVEVKVIGKTDNTLPYNGIDSPFYKVNYKGEVGYVLGGLIALEKKETKNNTYLFALKKEAFFHHLLVRTVDKNGDFTEISSQLGDTGFYIEVTDNKGLNDVQNIVHVINHPESCGVVGGDIYFFQTDSGLVKAIKTTVFSEAGVNWYNEELIFPTDEGGIANKILYKEEKGENGDEESNEIFIETTQRELRWEKGQLLPKKKEVN